MKSIRSFILILGMIIVMFCGVAWADTLGVSDENIKKRIEDKVANTSVLRGVKVNVAVEDGNVVLYGTVILYIQKMLYEQLAWKTVGVVEVDNEIQVVPQLPQVDSIIERKILDILHTHDRFQHSGLNIEVEKGSVSISGIFEHPRDVLFIKHRVAEIEGVIAVNLQVNFRI